MKADVYTKKTKHSFVWNYIARRTQNRERKYKWKITHMYGIHCRVRNDFVKNLNLIEIVKNL